MTSITIQSIPSGEGGIAYLATSNGKRSQGTTAGEALDALTRQLPTSEGGALVIVPDQRPDQFFNADQQRRLAELLEHRRACRDAGESNVATAESTVTLPARTRLLCCDKALVVRQGRIDR